MGFLNGNAEEDHIRFLTEVSEKDYRDDAALLKVMSHPVRLQILEGLTRGPCSVKAMWLGLNISQAAVSQHLAVMREAGVLKADRKGNRVFYSLASDKARRVLEAIQGDQPKRNLSDEYEEEETEEFDDEEGAEE